MGTADKCDAIVGAIDGALAENDRFMAGLGADAGDSPPWPFGHLSMPDPPGTTRIEVIRRALGAA
jgi:hypothetical protein